MNRYLAMGMIETRGLVAAIEAADAAAKTAEIALLRKEKVDAGLVSVRFVGETAAVQAATEAGSAAAARVGHLVSSHVIPRLDLMTARMLGLPVDDEPSAAQAPVASVMTPQGGDVRNSLEAMTTAELRALARSRTDFPVRGRALNTMGKQQLIEHLATLLVQGGHE